MSGFNGGAAKKTAFVTGGTAKDAAAMAVLLLNLKETNPGLADEAVIFHDGIGKKDRRLMGRIFPTRFVLYESPFEKRDDFDKGIIEYFSKMVFCKYECLRLLGEYETVIWSDYDVLITGDLSELKDFSQGEAIKMVVSRDTFRQQFSKTFKTEEFPDFDWAEASINMSLFSFSRRLQNASALYSRCVELTNELAPFLEWPEQAVLQMALQESKTAFSALDYGVYSCHPSEKALAAGAKVLHAYRQPKFWNGLHNEKWEAYYEEWRRMGGSKHLDRYNKLERFARRVNKKLRKVFARKNA